MPQHGVAAARLAPTKAFSTGRPSLGAPDITEVMWGATPFDQLACRIAFRSAHYQGKFTPPSTQTTIVYLTLDDVVDWHRASVNPVRKLMVTNTSHIPFLIKLTLRSETLSWLQIVLLA